PFPTRRASDLVSPRTSSSSPSVTSPPPPSSSAPSAITASTTSSRGWRGSSWTGPWTARDAPAACTPSTGSSSPAPPPATPTENDDLHRTLPGLQLSDHTLAVPLDHADPHGAQIDLFARVVTADGGEHRPYLVFLQGGPGSEAPRPVDASSSGWL